jgi:hypothetical protein
MIPIILLVVKIFLQIFESQHALVGFHFQIVELQIIMATTNELLRNLNVSLRNPNVYVKMQKALRNSSEGFPIFVISLT